MIPVENGVPINKEKATEDIVVIDLFGKQFQFKASKSLDDSKKIAERLTEYVVRAEEQIHNTASVQNRIVIVLLAGMNLANDLADRESELSELHDRVDRKSTDLLNKLNEFISKAG